jgi:hypothetical protein
MLIDKCMPWLQPAFMVHYLDIGGLKPRPTDTKIVGSKNPRI